MNFKENEAKDKLRGGYYTPLPIAQFLIDWVFQAEPASILEPSCGDGIFLDAIYNRIVDTDLVVGHSLSIDALELISEEVEKTQGIARKFNSFDRVDAEICQGEFFNWILMLNGKKKWDAIVGNPPYIRYQYFDKDQSIRAAKIFAKAGMKYTKRTNAWVPFILASVMHLNAGGRLAMVLPAELLHIMHAQGLRTFLEQEMEYIDILDVRELVFEGALQGIVLFRAIKHSNSNHANNQPNSCVPHIDRVDSTNHLENYANIKNVNGRQPLYGHWMYALLDTEEFNLLKHLERSNWIQSFRNLANVDIGIVTGANKYFVVNRETVEEYHLQNIATPMLARSGFMKGITYTPEDQELNESDSKPVLFLQFPDRPKTELPRLMQKYINLGEVQKLHTRYKTGIRNRWYVVPYIWIAELSMLKRCHHFPRLVLNIAQAYSTDTAYRIRMNESYTDRARDLVFSFLNSLTFLTAELEGRYYGGGVLELVPNEIEKLQIPLISPTKQQFEHVDTMIREKASVNELLNYTDAIILGNRLTQEEIVILQTARQRLQDRRLRN